MLDDNEQFLDIVGEYLNASLCRGMGETCYEPATEQFAMMCSSCAYVNKYTFCAEHSAVLNGPIILRMNPEKDGECEHWYATGDNGQGVSTVFILTREHLLP